MSTKKSWSKYVKKLKSKAKRSDIKTFEINEFHPTSVKQPSLDCDMPSITDTNAAIKIKDIAAKHGSNQYVYLASRNNQFGNLGEIIL